MTHKNFGKALITASVFTFFWCTAFEINHFTIHLYGPPKLLILQTIDNTASGSGIYLLLLIFLINIVTGFIAYSFPEKNIKLKRTNAFFAVALSFLICVLLLGIMGIIEVFIDFSR